MPTVECCEFDRLGVISTPPPTMIRHFVFREKIGGSVLTQDVHRGMGNSYFIGDDCVRNNLEGASRGVISMTCYRDM